MNASTRSVHDVALAKTQLQHYFRNYEEFLGPLRDAPITLLELGVADGESLRHWESYLPQARITGLDIAACPASFESGRVMTYQGEQQDTALLDKIAQERAPGGFDVIIDDASHVGQLTRISFWHLFENHLKPGGLYVIEDWGTGYWRQYPDGRPLRQRPVGFAPHERLLNRLHAMPALHSVSLLRRAVGWLRWHLVKRRHPSHDYGMVGFIKELVDEAGIEDATSPDFGTGTARKSRFDWMRLSLGQVIIRKAQADQGMLLKNGNGV